MGVVLSGFCALGWMRTHTGGRRDYREADIVEEIPEENSGDIVSAWGIATGGPALDHVLADIYFSKSVLVFLDIGAILGESTVYRRRRTLSSIHGGTGLYVRCTPCGTRMH